MNIKIIALIACLALGAGVLAVWVVNTPASNSDHTISEKERAFMERAPAPEQHEKF